MGSVSMFIVLVDVVLVALPPLKKRDTLRVLNFPEGILKRFDHFLREIVAILCDAPLELFRRLCLDNKERNLECIRYILR